MAQWCGLGSSPSINPIYVPRGGGYVPKFTMGVCHLIFDILDLFNLERDEFCDPVQRQNKKNMYFRLGRLKL